MKNDLTKVNIYTDGACSGNPGPGGWGAILECGGVTKELSGGAAETTNNRMELTAAIEALSALKRPCQVTLTTDSQYLKNGMDLGWAKKWKKNGWTRGKNQPALNPDLWDKLLQLFEIHQVKIVWVKGHTGHPMNERCDELAVAQSQKYRK